MARRVDPSASARTPSPREAAASATVARQNPLQHAPAPPSFSVHAVPASAGVVDTIDQSSQRTAFMKALQQALPADLFGREGYGGIAGAIFGVGDGIRHRFGVEVGLGVDWNFVTVKRTTFFSGVEAFLHAFPDDRGPTFYGGGSLSVGLHYAL